MTDVNVLGIPKQFQCGHCHQEEVVRLKDFVDLRNEILRRVDVLNNIERSPHRNAFSQHLRPSYINAALRPSS